MKEKLLALLLFSIGHALTWANVYGQFAWDFWKGKAVLAACIYAIPTSLLFWYGSRVCYESTGGAWGVRLLGFSASYFVFPFMTQIFLKESMFEPKTMVCILLSFLIIAVQMLWD